MLHRVDIRAVGAPCAWSVVVAATAACFHPTYDRPRCGPDGACPAGLTCSAAQVCESGGNLDDAGPRVDACWALERPPFEAISLCMSGIAPTLLISGFVVLDTDSGTSEPAGLTCQVVKAGNADLCAVIADAIRIPAGATLAAHGSRALALLGTTIDIAGTVDLASHNAAGGGRIGAGSTQSGCNQGAEARDNGGGAGGRFGGVGGNGGDGGTKAASGGRVAGSISTSVLRGGCPGNRPGDSAGAGGRGGGAVWISAITLQLRSSAILNASGASGASATAADHGAYGGGSGGMILIQAPAITLDPAAQVFANGGHGGCGAQGVILGAATIDPSGPASGGDTAPGGLAAGRGGPGFSATGSARDGGAGQPQMGSSGGGGGGGGGPGEIRVQSTSAFTGPNISPAAVPL